jgi:uncharacterized membrane protein
MDYILIGLLLVIVILLVSNAVKIAEKMKPEKIKIKVENEHTIKNKNDEW